MTNLENLKLLSAYDFWNEVTNLKRHVLHEYIDYPAYLESEDANLLDFVKHEGYCKVKPSEAELIVRCNEAAAQGRAMTESEKSLYIAEHTKTMMILKRGIFRFGEPYVVVCDMENMSMMSVPENLVESIR